MIDIKGKYRDAEMNKVERTAAGKRIGAWIILKDGELVGKVLAHYTPSGNVTVNIWDWTDKESIKDVWYGHDNFRIEDAMRGIPFGDMILPGKDSAQWYDNVRDAGYNVVYVI